MVVVVCAPGWVAVDTSAGATSGVAIGLVKQDAGVCCMTGGAEVCFVGACCPVRLFMATDTGVGGKDNCTVVINRALVGQEIVVVKGMATDACARSISCASIAICTGNQDASAWRMACGAGVVVVFGGSDDVATVAARAGCGAGDATVVFTLMSQLEVCGVGTVAPPTVNRCTNDMG